MKDQRSGSQILFGFLPEQTVDVKGGVWKVDKWVDAKVERNVDHESLRREICRVASPWRARNLDGNLVTELETKRASILVVSVDAERGVLLRQFPRWWQCRNGNCKRIFNSPDTVCPCGHRVPKGQLPFVMYCDKCGELKQPAIPPCPVHRQVAVEYPGTSTATEIRFVCPDQGCRRELKRGLGFAKCSCGADLKGALHRASSVFTPRSVVLVNPPSPEKMKRLHGAGGAQRALDWVVQGMKGSPMTSGNSMEALRRQLLEQGLAEAVVEAMMGAAKQAGSVDSTPSTRISDPEQRETAESQAVTIALALGESRVTLEDLARTVDPVSELGILYKDKYKLALKAARLEAVELLDSFPVLTGHYGFTRGNPEPGQSRLKAFRERNSTYKVYGDLAETEALFVRLDPISVDAWLKRNGFTLNHNGTAAGVRAAILNLAKIPGPSDTGDMNSAGAKLLTLVHSYCHRLIRITAVFAGIDRNSLSELLVPSHLGFFVYAAARGDFILGGLQAVFEGELDRLLSSFLSAERMCALDPGCSRSGCACAACMHLGEPSCRYYNRYLNRDSLFGTAGYLR
jgi:hypothetical protein